MEGGKAGREASKERERKIERRDRGGEERPSGSGCFEDGPGKAPRPSNRWPT